ncbi:MAG: Hsp20/alpha crystallin family protein [Bacillota bacterium]|nr:Hsp20/alpha crystallin family protein [Bacillota bacterium]
MRDLIRRTNGGEVDRIRSGIDQVFADAFSRNWPFYGEGAFPPVDLYNTEGSLVALVSLPGADINDVEVTANNDTLSIQGEIKVETGEGELLWQERTGGKFYRSFKLPLPIKADEVDASFKAGVLRVEMPKVDELKSRAIKIKEAK